MRQETLRAVLLLLIAALLLSSVVSSLIHYRPARRGVSIQQDPYGYLIVPPLGGPGGRGYGPPVISSGGLIFTQPTLY